MNSEIIEMREAIVKRGDSGTFVTMRKSFINNIIQKQDYSEIEQEYQYLGFQDQDLPKNTLIVSIACQFVKYTKEQTFFYMSHPKINGMVSEHSNASLIIRGPISEEWKVPVYVVYLPPYMK